MGDEKAGGEARVRQLRDGGRETEAVELLLELYGAEIGGWLIRTLACESDGREAYSLFLESLWTGMKHFRWESSLRTWAYRLARNAACRVLRGRGRTRLMSHSSAEAIAATPESEIKPWLCTAARTGVDDLLKHLKPQDRMILILRVDRGMTWQCVARVVYGEARCRDQRSLIARAAAVRQRFLRIKRHLRELAKKRGIIEMED